MVDDEQVATAVVEEMAKVRKFRAWLGFPLPPELRAAVEVQRAAAERALAEMLLGWEDLGGAICLERIGEAEPPPAPAGEVEDEATIHGNPSEEAPAAGFPGERGPALPDAIGLKVQTLRSDFPSNDSAVPTPACSLEVANPAHDVPTVSGPGAMAAPQLPKAKGPAASFAGKSPVVIQTPWGAGPLWGASSPVGSHQPAKTVEAAIVAKAVENASHGGMVGARRLVESCSRWSAVRRDIAVQLAELAAARVRAEQQRGASGCEGLLKTLFSGCEKQRLGAVHGLGKRQSPRSGSWDDDVRARLEALKTTATPVFGNKTDAQLTHDDERALANVKREVEAYLFSVEGGNDAASVVLKTKWMATLRRAFASGLQRDHRKLVTLFSPHPFVLDDPEFAKLRKAIRDFETKTDEMESDPSIDALGPAWPWFALTSGKRALIVGGEERPRQLERLRTVFKFASLDWHVTEGSITPLRQAVAKIQSGKVDLVLMIHRWCGHDADRLLKPACTKSGAAFIPVQGGHSVTGVSVALEKYGKAKENSQTRRAAK